MPSSQLGLGVRVRASLDVKFTTKDGQTTVSREIREALNLEEGDKLTWEVQGGKVAVTTERPAFWRWEGFIKVGPGDVVEDVAKARELEGRI